MSSWQCSVIPGVWTLPPSPPHKYPATFRLCVERCFEVFRNSHINRTAEIFIMSTFSLYRGDCNYQRMAPPSTIYEANQWEWSNSGNRHLLSCFDVSSVANVLGFPLFLAARTLWSYNNSYIFIHTLFCGFMFFMFLISLLFIRNTPFYLHCTQQVFICASDKQTCWMYFKSLLELHLLWKSFWGVWSCYCFLAILLTQWYKYL